MEKTKAREKQTDKKRALYTIVKDFKNTRKILYNLETEFTRPKAEWDKLSPKIVPIYQKLDALHNYYVSLGEGTYQHNLGDLWSPEEIKTLEEICLSADVRPEIPLDDCKIKVKGEEVTSIRKKYKKFHSYLYGGIGGLIGCLGGLPVGGMVGMLIDHFSRYELKEIQPAAFISGAILGAIALASHFKSMYYRWHRKKNQFIDIIPKLREKLNYVSNFFESDSYKGKYINTFVRGPKPSTDSLTELNNLRSSTPSF